MSVKCIRLTTGEEIIATAKETESGWEVEKPANIFMQPDGKGNVRVALIPLFPYAEKPEFIFPKSVIVVVFNPSTSLYNEYSRIFGSGLLIPSIDVDSKKLLAE